MMKISWVILIQKILQLFPTEVSNLWKSNR